MNITPKQKAVILSNYRYSPYTIARFLTGNGTPTTENEVNIWLDEYERALSDIERDYNENEVPKVRAQVKEMINEMPIEERQRLRRVYLEEELPKAKLAFLEACKEFAQRKDDVFRETHEKHIEKLERRLFKLGFDVKVVMGMTDGITPEKIAQARQYPITNLVKVNRAGMAKCPFHPDKNPSMDTRKNFFFCYGCGESGDVIDFVMKTENCSFVKAIETLSV